MYYRVSVAQNGAHIFATEKSSITSLDKCRFVAAMLRQAFPKSHGYEVTETKWEEVGTAISTMSDMIIEQRDAYVPADAIDRVMESTKHAFSRYRYGEYGWRECARLLLSKGFSEKMTFQILMSKHMRWAADGREDGEAREKAFERYLRENETGMRADATQWVLESENREG